MAWIKDEKKNNKKCSSCGSMMTWLDMPLSAGYHCETCAQAKMAKMPDSMSGTYFTIVAGFTVKSTPIPGRFSASSVVYNLFKGPEEAKKFRNGKQVVVEVEVEAENMTMMPQGKVSRLGSSRFVIIKVVP